MKYIKLFETTSALNAYKLINDLATPNAIMCEDAPTTMHYEPYHDYSQDYLTFKARETCTFTFRPAALSYSLDGGSTWTALAANTATPSLYVGDEICFKAELTPSSMGGIGYFSATGNFNAKGNVMSLLFGDNFKGQTSLNGKDYAFAGLFYNNTKLISAEYLSLPATTLNNYCYSNMFRDCTSLTTAPSLPATTLANQCYGSMFKGCTSLTTAPELPATTLAESCYGAMFEDCTSLTTAPSLPATILILGCYGYMFSGCTSLTTAPSLPAMTLTSNCYYGMFSGCTSLTTAPELPATTLANYCYSEMFSGCTSLNYIKALFTTTPSSTYTDIWVSDVAASGTFVKSDSATWNVTGTNGIPSGWTVQTYTP